MTVECRVSNLSLVSRADLASQATVSQLCARSGIPGSGPFAAGARGMTRPDNTVPGNCGEAWLYIYSTSHSGTTRFRSGAYPWYSAIDYGSATLFYQNLTKGNWQTWDDYVHANYQGWFWEGDDYRFTKTGIVYSYIFGDVLLRSGVICSIDFPTDTETIH
jgi:hypothetical protein